MIRTLLLLLLLAAVTLLAATFAWLNPGTLTLDLAFGEVEVLKSQAFAITLALGWLFGWLTSGVFVIKLVNERRKLRRSVRLAEAEVNNLRSLPVKDAG